MKGKNLFENAKPTEDNDSVVLVGHKSAWPQLFETERARLKKALSAGYIFKIEHIGSISIPELISKPVIDILIRDYLRKNPGIARQYGELKRNLATRYRHNRRAYSEAKSQFIESISDLASDKVAEVPDVESMDRSIPLSWNPLVSRRLFVVSTFLAFACFPLLVSCDRNPAGKPENKLLRLDLTTSEQIDLLISSLDNNDQIVRASAAERLLGLCVTQLSNYGPEARSSIEVFAKHLQDPYLHQNAKLRQTAMGAINKIRSSKPVSYFNPGEGEGDGDGYYEVCTSICKSSLEIFRGVLFAKDEKTFLHSLRALGKINSDLVLTALRDSLDNAATEALLRIFRKDENPWVSVPSCFEPIGQSA